MEWSSAGNGKQPVNHGVTGNTYVDLMTIRRTPRHTGSSGSEKKLATPKPSRAFCCCASISAMFWVWCHCWMMTALTLLGWWSRTS
jgi:hypothetical protein